jgi:hypothetical protein
LQPPTIEIRPPALIHALFNEAVIPAACTPKRIPKQGEHIPHVLPRLLVRSHEGAMTGISISYKCATVVNELGSQGIEVDVPHELKEIGILFTEDRLVAILEERTMTPISLVETNSIPGE